MASTQNRQAISQLIEESILQLCRVGFQSGIEVDGIVCITEEDTKQQIVVKVHERLENGIDSNGKHLSFDSPSGGSSLDQIFGARSEFVDTATYLKSAGYRNGNSHTEDASQNIGSSIEIAQNCTPPKFKVSPKVGATMNQTAGSPLVVEIESSGSDRDTVSTQNSGSSRRKQQRAKLRQLKPTPSRQSVKSKPPMPFRCKHCIFGSENWRILFKHYSKSHQLYPCRICKKMFTVKDRLIRHLKMHGKLKSYSCTRCKARFPKKLLLSKHLETHKQREGTEFTCNICHHTENSAQLLSSHFETGHSKKMLHVCTVCFVGFTQTSVYLQHVTSHPGRQSFNCSHCDITYDSQLDLLKHTAMHTGSGTGYTCRGCEKSFKDAQEYSDHFLEHADSSKENIFECCICSQICSNLSELRAHEKSHVGQMPVPEKIHVCPHCQKSFKLYTKLRDHMESHSEVKKCRCHLCGKRFNQQRKLRMHLDLMHRGNKKNFKLSNDLESVSTTSSASEDFQHYPMSFTIKEEPASDGLSDNAVPQTQVAAVTSVTSPWLGRPQEAKYRDQYNFNHSNNIAVSPPGITNRNFSDIRQVSSSPFKRDTPSGRSSRSSYGMPPTVEQDVMSHHSLNNHTKSLTDFPALNEDEPMNLSFQPKSKENRGTVKEGSVRSLMSSRSYPDDVFMASGPINMSGVSEMRQLEQVVFAAGQQSNPPPGFMHPHPRDLTPGLPKGRHYSLDGAFPTRLADAVRAPMMLPSPNTTLNKFAAIQRDRERDIRDRELREREIRQMERDPRDAHERESRERDQQGFSPSPHEFRSPYSASIPSGINPSGVSPSQMSPHFPGSRHPTQGDTPSLISPQYPHALMRQHSTGPGGLRHDPAQISPGTAAHLSPNSPNSTTTSDGPGGTPDNQLPAPSTFQVGELRCDICGILYENFPLLENHAKVVHNRFPCEICCKSFTQKGNRDRHFRIHTGEKPYACQECGVSFMRGDDLKYHHSTKHVVLRPFDCKICHGSFHRKADYVKHMQLHNIDVNASQGINVLRGDVLRGPEQGGNPRGSNEPHQSPDGDISSPNDVMRGMPQDYMRGAPEMALGPQEMSRMSQSALHHEGHHGPPDQFRSPVHQPPGSMSTSALMPNSSAMSMAEAAVNATISSLNSRLYSSSSTN